MHTCVRLRMYRHEGREPRYGKICPGSESPAASQAFAGQEFNLVCVSDEGFGRRGVILDQGNPNLARLNRKP